MKEIRNQWNTPNPDDPNVNIKPMEYAKIPPWEPLEVYINTELLTPVTKAESPEFLRAETLRAIETKYKNHLKIYTDGSKIVDNNN